MNIDTTEHGQKRNDKDPTCHAQHSPQRTGADDGPGPKTAKILWVHKSENHFIAPLVPGARDLYASSLGAFNSPNFHALALVSAADRQVRWAKGSGGVIAKLKGIEATAAQFEVDVAHRSVKLSGGVKLSRGRGWVTADSAAIDINTRKVTLEDVKGSIPVQAPER